MEKEAAKPKATRKTKIETIQEMYGKDVTKATLQETSDYLKSKGFKALGDLLQPAK